MLDYWLSFTGWLFIAYLGGTFCASITEAQHHSPRALTHIEIKESERRVAKTGLIAVGVVALIYIIFHGSNA
jgi:hypothetical protein